MKFYLRMEGVNLSNFVYDTQDLSTSRGGGLLLLNAVNLVKRHFDNLRSISTGASAGVFLFEAKSDGDAAKRRDAVLRYLKDQFRYATFVVDVASANGGFRDAVEQVIALNRFRQMRSPALVYPDAGTQGKVCNVDYVRPATREGSWRGEEPNRWKERISGSVQARREYGREQKQDFYRALLPSAGKSRDEIRPDSASIASEWAEAFDELYRFLTSDGDHFTHDLEELTVRGTDEPLSRKMAVIYIDGNGFGDIQAKCRDENELQAWDETIKNNRTCLLADLWS